MDKKIQSLLIIALATLGCGEVKEFVIGQTSVKVYDFAQPWDDFPEVMRKIQLARESGIPEDLWGTTVHIYPTGIPIFGSTTDAICYYRNDTQDLHIRSTEESTYEGCLGHEFAHRWVDIHELDKDCKEKDIHQCAGWKEKNWEMQKAICPLSWKFKGDCKKLFEFKPEFVDGAGRD